MKKFNGKNGFFGSSIQKQIGANNKFEVYKYYLLKKTSTIKLTES